MVKTQEDNLAGNEQSSQNPGQAYYNREFDKIARAEEIADLEAKYNGSYTYEPEEDEERKRDDSLDDVSDAADLLQGAESSGGGGGYPGGRPPLSPGGPKKPETFGGRLGAWAKNFSPTAGIFSILAGGGALTFSVFLLPAALVTSLDDILMNDSSDSTRMNVLMRRAFVSAIIGKADCSTTAKCRFTTMSEEHAKKWRDAGFRLEPEQPDKDGRYRITAIVFPDNGPRVTNSRDFFAYADGNVRARESVDKVVHSRSSPYNAKHSKYRKVLGKWGLSKSKIFTASTDKDKAARTKAMDAEIDKHTGGDAYNDPDPDSRKKKMEDKQNSLKIFDSTYNSRIQKAVGGKALDRAASAVDVASMVCTAHFFQKMMVAGVKVLVWKELIGFAYPFLQTMAQVKDQGNAEPERVEYIFDRLTGYITKEIRDLKKELYGDYADSELHKNAMDSRGIKAMIHGNLDALTEFAERYMGWKAAALVIGNGTIDAVEKAFGGKENLKDICFGTKVLSFATMAQCFTNPVSFSICTAIIGANQLFADDIMKAAGAAMIAPALYLVAKMNLAHYLKGPRLGDAIAAGVSLMLADYARGGGLTGVASVGAVTKLQKWAAATDDVYNSDVIELAQYEAKKDPFNPTNRYSFISQLAASFNIGRDVHAEQSPFSHLTNLFAVAATPLNILNGKAGAVLNQPSQLGRSAAARVSCNNNINNPKDAYLDEIGVAYDCAAGDTVSTAPDGVAEALSQQVRGNRNTLVETVQYMIDNKFIDQDLKVTGDTNPDGPDGDKEDKGTEYEYIKFKNYCTEDRIDPPGHTTHNLDEGVMSSVPTEDMEWWIYARCAGNDYRGKPKNDPKLTENLFYFSIYYNLCETQVPMAEEKSACWEAAQVSRATPNTGDWISPVPAPCGDGMGAGRGHMGIDLETGPAAEGVMPILAPTSLKIVGHQSKDQNKAGGNTVLAVATDGSNYGFSFMHMYELSHLPIGAEVAKGEKIGIVGNTGTSTTSAHVHMEVYAPGTDPNSFSNEVDPEDVFAEHGVVYQCRGDGD